MCLQTILDYHKFGLCVFLYYIFSVYSEERKTETEEKTYFMLALLQLQRDLLTHINNTNIRPTKKHFIYIFTHFFFFFVL